MKKYKYLIIASLVSPFLGVFLYTYIDLLLTALHGAKFEGVKFVISSGATALVGSMFSIPLVLFLGLPTYYFLKNINLSKSWAYCLIGYIGGTISFLLFLYRSEYTFNEQLKGINMFGFCGLFVSLIFWYIAVHLPKRQSSTNKSFNQDAPR